MAIGRASGVEVLGVEAFSVSVEVALQGGKPGISIVGLPDKAVSESADRVKAAVAHSGFSWPGRGGRKIVVNLAPAGMAKKGAMLDLPIAAGVLAAGGEVPEGALGGWFLVGELALDGSLRPGRGVLAAALLAKESGARGIVVPASNAEEAAVGFPGGAFGAERLEEVVRFLRGEAVLRAVRMDVDALFEKAFSAGEDFAGVKGQEHAKRAIAVACAGGHNLLMVGPPGAGKSMLARRIPSILPPLSFDEALETTRIHSAAGLLPAGDGLVTRRPFRAPHHTVSDAGLVGGGGNAVPGEISLAHNGVLFLDEFPEFGRRHREALRQPMEDGEISVSRVAYSVKFPARFMLVAAMNPCPCGYFGDTRRRCRCTSTQIEKYLARVSGPLLDRMDIQIEVPAVEYSELRSDSPGSDSASLREVVRTARERQEERFRGEERNGKPIHSNAEMGEEHLARFCRLDAEGETLLRRAVEELGLSARAVSRVLKVARTISDMAGRKGISAEDLAEAIQYRALDRLGLW